MADEEVSPSSGKVSWVFKEKLASRDSNRIYLLSFKKEFLKLTISLLSN
tara:strand:- start:1034 stop:1180 length:147 start_codon:yes stop_codon:yes gene_type:complete